MTDNNLSELDAGFESEALGSQAVFRSALQALSHPGRLIDIAHCAQVPEPAHSAAALFLLAMLDTDCTLWLSPALAKSKARLWLHFHTGCQVVKDASHAQFLWVAQGDVMPALASLAQGSEEYPDQSATCVIEVAAMSTTRKNSLNWSLQGPGIESQNRINVAGLDADFVRQWTENHERFPRGVDVFISAPNQLVGLPRTTLISIEGVC